jgi:transcriptional regulator with XRE-family HTH domain
MRQKCRHLECHSFQHEKLHTDCINFPGLYDGGPGLWRKMGIYQIFASNLREECLRHGTIADVCRGIGINRQQFNKYLAGQTLPNAATLRRICDYLQIQEHELLTEKAGDEAIFNARRSQRFLTSFEHFVRTIVPEGGLSQGPDLNAIEEGNYFCYFPLPNSPQRLLRSLVRITRVRGLTYFSRLTRTNSTGKGFVFRGKHIGIVTASAGSIHFLGRNRVSPYQLSFMSFDTKNKLNNKYLFGVGITRSTVDAIGLRIVFEHLSNVSIRQAVKKIGQVPGTELDPIIVAALAQPTDHGQFLSFASLDTLITAAFYSTDYPKVPKEVNSLDEATLLF